MKRKSILKRIGALPLAVLILALLAACAGGGNADTTGGEQIAADTATAAPADTALADTAVSDDTNDAPDDGPENIEIRATWWGDTVRNDLYMQIIEGFMERYPHIHVIPEPTSWGDYFDRLAIQTAGGNAPDFISMNPQFAADYILRGVLEPLDRFVADGTLDFTGWEEGTVNTGRHDGQLFMVPMGVAVFANYINVSMFNELGIDLPESVWYWDDVRTIGLQAREALDAAGMRDTFFFNDWSGSWSNFHHYARARGYYLWTPDGELGFPVEILQEFWEMFDEFRSLRIIPDGATVVEFVGATLEDNMFSRRTVMVSESSANQFPMWNVTFPDVEIRLQRYPQIPGGRVSDFPSGSSFAVAASSSDERQRTAAMLINYWVNTEEALELFRLDQGVPGNVSLHPSFVPYLNDYQQQLMDFTTWILSMATPTVFAPRGATEADSLFAFYGEMLSFGMIDPASAAHQFYEEAAAAIERHRD